MLDLFRTTPASSSPSRPVAFALMALSALMVSGCPTTTGTGITVPCSGQDGEATPPLVDILAPAEGAVFADGEAVPFLAQISDDVDAVGDLLVEWSSTVDGTFDTAAADADGRIEFDYDGLSVGVHPITLRVTDLDDCSAEDDTAVEIQ